LSKDSDPIAFDITKSTMDFDNLSMTFLINSFCIAEHETVFMTRMHAFLLEKNLTRSDKGIITFDPNLKGSNDE
jgi:hypothetical protein